MSLSVAIIITAALIFCSRAVRRHVFKRLFRTLDASFSSTFRLYRRPCCGSVFREAAIIPPPFNALPGHGKTGQCNRMPTIAHHSDTSIAGRKESGNYNCRWSWRWHKAEITADAGSTHNRTKEACTKANSHRPNKYRSAMNATGQGWVVLKKTQLSSIVIMVNTKARWIPCGQAKHLPMTRTEDGQGEHSGIALG